MTNDPMKHPAIIYVPNSCKCPLEDCEERGRSTLCYLENNHLTCDLYEGELAVKEFLDSRRTLIEMMDQGFEKVAEEGGYYILVDYQGVMRTYDPKTDQILPFIERREDFHET